MKPLISLVSMVKNEEGVLQRMIDSVKDIVDEFIIVDTGSTDSTKEIIAKYGKVYEIPFVNFVETKNKCLELATGEYILFMDADEVLYQGANIIREWAEGRNVEALSCKITEGPSDDYYSIVLQYNRLRLWRNNGLWKFEGPGVHEVCVGPHLPVIDYRVSVRHDHSNKAPESVSQEKYKLWETLLLDAISKNENNARAWFYLGRTRMDLNRKLESISTYMHYLEIPNNNFVDERWQAAYDIAKQYVALGELNKALGIIELAESIDTRRREHLNLKGYVHFIRQDFEKAIDAYELANSRPFPTDVSLFISPQEYELTSIDQLVLCNYHAKKYDVAEKWCIEETKRKHDQRVLNNLWWCRTKTHMKIFLTLGYTPEPVWGGMINSTGVGGVETTYIELGRTLAALGHDVFLFCYTNEYHEYENVKYIPLDEYLDYVKLNPDVIITSRWFDSLKDVSCKKILWLQDANPLEAKYDFSFCDKVIVSSQWHKDYLITLAGHNIGKNKLDIIPLGIDKKLFQNTVNRDNLHVVYSSNPNRGLDILANIWPELEEKIPGIHLSVLYGWQGLSTWSKEEEWKKNVYLHEQEIKNKLSNYNVNFKGRLTKQEVAKTLMSASLLVYPCNFYETFCLTSLEAQAAGCVVVTSNMGALSTTTFNNSNILLEGSPLSKKYQQSFIQNVVNLITRKNDFDLKSFYNRNKILNGPYDWHDIAKQWQHLIWDII